MTGTSVSVAGQVSVFASGFLEEKGYSLPEPLLFL